MSKAAPQKRPASVTHFGITLVGLIGLVASVAGLRLYFEGRVPSHAEIGWSALAICVATLLPVLLLDMVYMRSWRNASTGLDWSKKFAPDLSRVFYKSVGLLLTLSVLALVYWVVPFYATESYTSVFMTFVHNLWWLAPLAVLYIAVVDGLMREPKDEYWMLGYGLLRSRKVIDRQKMRHHVLAWTVKGFFAPMMVTFLMGNTGAALRNTIDFSNPMLIIQFAVAFAYLVDLVFAVGGYLLTFRLTDTHIRSVEPTALGWLVAIMCYPPFWSAINNHIAPYGSISGGYQRWLMDTPYLMYAWGSVMAALILFYALATVVFGLRFSNLTHRGIITGGPYRLTKHPAYLSKNLAWWMTAVPFVPMLGWQNSIKACLMLLFVNFVYYMRARTEERHLSRDPAYVDYALYMEKHGPLRFLNRIFPFVRYKAPQTKQDTAHV